jgi:hypothetical protein
MFFGAFNLDCPTLSISISGQGEDCIQKPISRRASQEIVAPAQIEIARNVRAAGALRALGRLSQRDFPRFVEFSHSMGSKQQT